MKRVFFILLSTFFFANAHSQTLSGDAIISLLTCTPGEPLYFHYGHTALRVKDTAQGIDWVFNYGTFSFATENFYIKFLRGQTIYQLSIQDAHHFFADYEEQNRKVFSQTLNLNATQRDAIWSALQKNYEPQNRHYLYNYVYDNCATRPLHLLCAALQDSLRSTYAPKALSFRDAVRPYTGLYSWADFGINIIFGKPADKLMTQRERLFLPFELMAYCAEATFQEGTHFIDNQGVGEFPRLKIPFFKTFWIGIIIFLITIILITFWDYKQRKISWWFDAIFFAIYSILGALIVFLWFFSIHPLVQNNWNVLLYNPLFILLLFFCCTTKGRAFFSLYAHYLVLYLIIVLGIGWIAEQHLMLQSCIFPILHISIRYFVWKIPEPIHNKIR